MSRNKRIQLAKNFMSPPKCGDKRRYDSQQEAQQIAEEQELLNPGLNLRIYKCILPGCHGWHLTRDRTK